MRAVLASPWHPRHSHNTVVLEVVGRRSGRRYRLPVSYVEDRGDLLVFVDEADRKVWWRNLRGGAPVRVLLRGRWQARRADVAGDDDPKRLAEALARFAAAWPGFIDLGLPPGASHLPGDLLPVAHDCAVITMTNRAERSDGVTLRPRRGRRR
jgi:deazaflavin-dependent oxidoreductase (nitroreductase family)